MYKLILVFCLLITLFACKKREVEAPKKDVTYPSYSNFKIGNYWVYANYLIDENGEYFRSTDCTYIIGDTIIRGHRYFIQNGLYENSFLRDSLHYMVNSIGEIFFSSEDFNTIFKTEFIVYGDTVCKSESKMGERNVLTKVPAGTFKTNNFTYTFHMYPGYDNPNPITYAYFKYSEGIGLVFSRIPFLGNTNSAEERRLLRYKVE